MIKRGGTDFGPAMGSATRTDGGTPMVDASTTRRKSCSAWPKRTTAPGQSRTRSQRSYGTWSRRRREHRVSAPESEGFLVRSSFRLYLLHSAVLPADLFQGAFDHQSPTHGAHNRLVDSQVSCDLVG